MNHRKTKSMSSVPKYGPTLAQEPNIASTIGYRISKKPSGLRKKTKQNLYNRKDR